MDDTQKVQETLRYAASQNIGSIPDVSVIKARAGKIRRRRQAMVGAAAFVAVAGISPVVINTLPTQQKADTLQAAETERTVPQQGVAEDAAGYASMTDSGSSLSWVEGNTVHTPSGQVSLNFGGTGEVEIGNIEAFGAGWIAFAYSPQGGANQTVIFNASGDPVKTFSGESFVVDKTNTYAAIEETPTEVQIVDSTGQVQQTYPKQSYDTVSSIWGCDTQCQVVGQRWTEEEGPSAVVYTNAGAQPFGQGVVEVTDITSDGDLAAVVTQLNDEGTCAGVWDMNASELVWETCEASYFTFNPTGDLLLGLDPYLDGAYHNTNTIWSVQGTKLQTISGAIVDEVWTSATTWATVQGDTQAETIGIVEHTVGEDTVTQIVEPKKSSLMDASPWRLVK